MRLRPVTVSRRKRLDLHAVLVRSALERHDREFADRDPNGNAVQRFNARLHAMGPDVERMPDVPDPIETGSEQGIKIFRPITVADGLHPEARAFFADDELSDVVNEARAVPVLNRLDYKHFDYVENSEHAALVGFQTEAQEKADRAHQQKREAQAAKRKRRAERHKVAVDLAEPVDQDEAKKARAEAEKWAGRRREHNAEVSDRLKYGAYYPGGKVADHQYGPTWEFLGEGVLRSHLDPSLARVAALYPTAESGNLRAGHDKTALLTTTCKLFALDAPYVELNRKMAGCLVVELDSVLRIEEFRASLLEILGPYRMPNLIVGRISKSGFMVRPHLIWILKTPVWYEPYKEWTDADTGEVRSSGREDCKTKPIAKFHAVQRGLTQLLLPLGADPACWNVWKPKNPLSLFWTTVVANGDCWHDLGDFDQIKGWPEKVDEAAMAETAAKMRAEAAGATATASNLAWNLCSHVIQPLARLQLSVREPDFIAAGQSTPALAAWFDKQVRPVVEGELGRSDALDRILERQCLFAANWCRGRLTWSPRRRKSRFGKKPEEETAKTPPKRKRRPAARGRDRDLIESNMTLKARKELAGKLTDRHRHTVTMWHLKKELYVAMMAGSVDKTAFIRDVCPVSKSTAYKHWDEACASLGIEFRDGAYRYIAKPTSGQSLKPSSAKQPIRASDSVRPTPSAAPSCGHPAKTIDPPWSDPVSEPVTAVPPDPPWQTHVQLPAELRQQTVSRVPEPA